MIARAKIVDYLLNPHHSLGGPKARFFMAFGFHPDRPGELADALAEHRHAPQTKPEESADAVMTKLVFTGPIASPDGRNLRVRTVWSIDREGIARLITAVPLKGDRS